MKLVISVTSGKYWEQILPNINIPLVDSIAEALEQDESVRLLSTPLNVMCEDSLDALYAFDEVCVLYHQAEIELAEKLSEGVEFSDALEHCICKIERLNSIKKKKRRQIKLINIDQVLVDSDPSMCLSNLIGADVRTFDVKTTIDQFYLLCANQAVRQTSHLNALNEMLNASNSVVADDFDMKFNSDTLLQCHQNLIQEARDGAEENTLLSYEIIELHGTVERINSLSKQQHEKSLKINRQQSEIAITRAKENQQLKAERFNLEEINDLLQNDVIALSSQNDGLQTDVLALSSQNDVFQTNVNDLRNQNDQLSKQIEKKEAEQKELSKQLSNKLKLIQQKNEKLHKFSQKIKKLNIEAVSQHKNIEQLEQSVLAKENSLEQSQSVNTELHSVIEDKLAEIEESNQARLSLKSEFLSYTKKTQREIKKYASELRRFKATNASSTSKIEELESELETIKCSLLWKSTKPLRSVTNAFNKGERDKAKFEQNMALLMSSQYFDMQWYLNTYPDVAAADINPAEHYLKFGYKEKRYPSPIFDPNWYLDKYEDVRSSGMNPLIHFIKYGEPEGRRPSPKLLQLHKKPKSK